MAVNICGYCHKPTGTKSRICAACQRIRYKLNPPIRRHCGRCGTELNKARNGGLCVKCVVLVSAERRERSRMLSAIDTLEGLKGSLENVTEDLKTLAEDTKSVFSYQTEENPELIRATDLENQLIKLGHMQTALQAEITKAQKIVEKLLDDDERRGPGYGE